MLEAEPARASSSATSSSRRTRGCGGTSFLARRSRERLGAHGVPELFWSPAAKPGPSAQGSARSPSDGAASVARAWPRPGSRPSPRHGRPCRGHAREVHPDPALRGGGGVRRVGLSNVLGLPGERRIASSPGIEGPTGDTRLVPDPASAVALVALGPAGRSRPSTSGIRRATRGRRAGAPSLGGCSSAWRSRARAPRRVRARVLPREPDLGARGRRARSDPRHTGPGYSAPVLADQEPFATELIRALETQGTGVMQFHPEYSTGQFEISVPHRAPGSRSPTPTSWPVTRSERWRRTACRLVRARRVRRPGGQRRPPALQPVEPRRRNLFHGGDGPEA